MMEHRHQAAKDRGCGLLRGPRAGRFNDGMSDPIPGNDPNAAYEVVATQGWPHW
jgi:hypothetical protein